MSRNKCQKCQKRLRVHYVPRAQQYVATATTRDTTLCAQEYLATATASRATLPESHGIRCRDVFVFYACIVFNGARLLEHAAHARATRARANMFHVCARVTRARRFDQTRGNVLGTCVCVCVVVCA